MTNNDIETVIKTRRSTRVFGKEIPTREVVSKLIEMATHAPSACNTQGWRFVVIDEDKVKEKLVDAGGSVVIKNAPVGILVLYDNRTKNTEYADHIQSAAAAIQNLLLAAHALGLGACWLCHIPPKKQLRKIFNIPEAFSPIAYVLLGYKKSDPVDVPRKYNTEDLVSYNTFSSKIPVEIINTHKLLAQKFLKKIYDLTPAIIKRRWLNKYIDKKFVKKFKN